MDGTMTNEQIAAEFEELFGSGEPDEEEPDTEETEEEEAPEEETDDSEEEEESDEDSEEDEDEEETADDNVDTSDRSSDKGSARSKQAKQNHAFAEQRLQIKKNEDFIRSIGKLIGVPDDTPLSEIQDKVKDALIAKEAKENNISVDLMKRLDRAEELLQENDRIKLEKKVTEDFSELIDKHNLDEEAVQEFTQYLIDNGKNPMLDSNVDIEAEYLKLHYEDMVQQAVANALAKETARKKKVEDNAPAAAPNGGKDKEEPKINSVKDLDDLFNSMDL